MTRKHSHSALRFYCRKTRRWHTPASTQEMVLQNGEVYLWWSCPHCVDSDETRLPVGLDHRQQHLKRIGKRQPRVVAGIPVIGTLDSTTNIPALVVNYRWSAEQYAPVEEHTYA